MDNESFPLGAGWGTFFPPVAGQGLPTGRRARTLTVLLIQILGVCVHRSNIVEFLQYCHGEKEEYHTGLGVYLETQDFERRRDIFYR